MGRCVYGVRCEVPAQSCTSGPCEVEGMRVCRTELKKNEWDQESGNLSQVACVRREVC